MKKPLAVAVILLFIGLAFAPSINANVSKESINSELVEITTEVCGIKGVKPHTVKLTKQESLEVEQLFDSIKEQLDKVETREEAVEIFNEAVVELDKYGLLGGLSVKQAQKLVTGGYRNPRIMHILEKLYGKIQTNNDSNFLCLIAGMTEWPGVSFQGPLARNAYKLFFLFIVLGYIFYVELDLPYFSEFWVKLASLALIGIYFPCHLFGEFINPIPIGYTIGLGGYSFYVDDFIPAEGKIFTIGLTGIKAWNGEFYGCLPLFPNMFYIFILPFLPGVTGFTGIKFTNFNIWKSFFLGFALWVRIDEEPPDFPWYP